MNRIILLVTAFPLALGASKLAVAEPPDPSQLQMVPWTPANMVQDPVAIAFDRHGRAYVVETARRSTVDIDIRGHRSWLLDDLASDDFESMRHFFRSQMAPSRSAHNQSWLQDRNRDGSHDYRDLTMVKERIRIVEDTDGDGTADKSTLFAEGFNEEFSGVAAGVLPYQGDVLFTVYPDLWRLRDHDGDLVADSHESLFRGFGVHAALDGHDLHGLTVGPEGKIYFSCGDNGFSIVNQEGKRLYYPNTGGVLRMNPDGSDLEVFAIGLRNVQEFDFDQFGNMFGVDNDGDLEDERERAVYIAEGSDAGWRVTWQFRSPGWAEHNGGMTYNPWIADGMWKPAHANQPAHMTPPMNNYSVGPGGFKFNPGTALGEAYRDFFFCVQFPVQQITAFRTRPSGAGFVMFDDHVLHRGLMVSSLNFGPDGAMYLADWVGKWQPNGEGRIYRVDDPTTVSSSIRRSVQELVNNGLKTKTDREVVALLGHSDRRVRQLAQHELAAVRKQLALLIQIANDTSASQLARIHAMWGTIQYHQQNSVRAQEVKLAWRDEDPQIRQQCARVAGDLRLPSSLADLTRMLDDETDLVRSHAAIALGKLKAPRAIEPLIDLARKNNDEDPFIRHAVSMGLAGCATADRLAALTQDTQAVQLAAIVALRRQQSDRITAFLNMTDTTHPRVVAEAARAAHDDTSIPAALPKLANLILGDVSRLDEATLRRSISANFRLGTHDAARRLIDWIVSSSAEIQDPTLRDTLRVEALQCLARWNQNPLIDRVEGRIRNPIGREADAGRQALIKHLPQLLNIDGSVVTSELLHIAEALSLPLDEDMLAQWVVSQNTPSNTRVGAIRLLASRQSERLKDMLPFAVVSQDTAVHRAALEVAVDLDPQQTWDHMDWNTKDRSLLQFYVSILPRLTLSPATKKLAHLVAEHQARAEPHFLSLDVFEAVSKEQQRMWLRKLQDSSGKGAYRLAQVGGDPDRGRFIYNNHVSAQCVRCHDAGGLGNQAGPVLDGIGSRVDRGYLLESLVDPSAKIAKGFATVTLLLLDGRSVSGTILHENNEQIVLALSNGKRTEIPTSEVEERVESNVSTMPDMTSVLTPKEIRDLVAYLATRIEQSP